MKGMERVIVGYAGGEQTNPTYYKIQDHSEALFIEFNPQQVSYWQILEMWHDNDNPWKRETRQYRSAILFTSLTQQDEALYFLERLAQSKPSKRLYTDVELVKKFYQAEVYHQNYKAKRQLQTQQRKKE
jgi:methionine-S-sulfoxide reductase